MTFRFEEGEVSIGIHHARLPVTIDDWHEMQPVEHFAQAVSRCACGNRAIGRDKEWRHNARVNAYAVGADRVAWTLRDELLCRRCYVAEYQRLTLARRRRVCDKREMERDRRAEYQRRKAGRKR